MPFKIAPEVTVTLISIIVFCTTGVSGSVSLTSVEWEQASAWLRTECVKY